MGWIFSKRCNPSPARTIGIVLPTNTAATMWWLKHAVPAGRGSWRAALHQLSSPSLLASMMATVRSPRDLKVGERLLLLAQSSPRVSSYLESVLLGCRARMSKCELVYVTIEESAHVE